MWIALHAPKTCKTDQKDLLIIKRKTNSRN